MEQKEKKTLGYRMGELFAAVLAVCVSLIAIAATIKFCLMIMM